MDTSRLEKYGEVKDASSKRGVHIFVECPNGYTASVIRNEVSYGFSKGCYEVAVMRSEDGKILYDTPVTSDVLGWLTEDDVVDVVGQIAALERRWTP